MRALDGLGGYPSAMADLSQGTVLGERFTVVGVVGRGGSAVVYLAEDRLRGHRVALKVVHPHMAGDPAVRARLQREVAAAAALQDQGALVPYDLHELDGHLALSMPFHPGQTLGERVAADGALSPEQVRALGARLARTLVAAHRAGVLHRDVTPGNVLLDHDASQTVLTDFGLARVAQSATQRSTGLLGTAGYAAPEVYAGERADPRSDLYGLGAVLYLAATGKPAFDARNPMGALQAQLDESWEPLAKARPDLPEDLCATIEALLRREPDDRPEGAREVLDALEQRTAPSRAEAPAVGAGSPPAAGRRQYLPPGRFTVVIKEKDEDSGRRDLVRAQGKGGSPGGEFVRWGKHLIDNIRDALGIPPGQGPTPEEQLVDAVAAEAGLEQGAVLVGPGMLAKEFRLVDATDEPAAARLADAARLAGFKAKVVEVRETPGWLRILERIWWLPIPLGWAIPPIIGWADGTWVGIMVAVTIVLSVLRGVLTSQLAPDLDMPIAYRAGLERSLAPGEHAEPRYTVADAEALDAPALPAPPPVPAAPPTRGEALRARAAVALDALAATITDLGDALPTVAARDLRGTVDELREQADRLAVEVDRLQAAVAEEPATSDVSWVTARLDRLRTLEKAGDAVDRSELARLQATLDAHEAEQAAAERVEGRLTAATAQLLEIRSTASRVRRDLLAEADPGRSAGELVARLRREARAAEAAREEAAGTLVESDRDRARRAQAREKVRG